MEISKFIKTLISTFTKSDVEKTCAKKRDTLRDIVIPQYANAAKYFDLRGSGELPEIKEFNTTYKRKVGARGTNLVNSIAEDLQDVLKLADHSIIKIHALYGDNEASVGLTFEKATWLRVVAALGFTTDYALRFLNYICVLETAKLVGYEDQAHQIVPAEKMYLEQMFDNFCVCMNILNRSPDRIEKTIETLPVAVVSDESVIALNNSLGNAKTDPLGFNGFTVPADVSAKWNVMYWVGVVYADLMVASYNEAKAQAEIVQLRVLQLEKIHAKNPDPRLEKEIAYQNERLNGLKYEINKLEKKYG